MVVRWELKSTQASRSTTQNRRYPRTWDLRTTNKQLHLPESLSITERRDRRSVSEESSPRKLLRAPNCPDAPGNCPENGQLSPVQLTRCMGFRSVFPRSQGYICRACPAHVHGMMPLAFKCVADDRLGRIKDYPGRSDTIRLRRHRRPRRRSWRRGLHGPLIGLYPDPSALA